MLSRMNVNISLYAAKSSIEYSSPKYKSVCLELTR